MSQSKILRETIYKKFKELFVVHPLVTGIFKNAVTPDKARLYALQNFGGVLNYIRVLESLKSQIDSDGTEDLSKFISLAQQKKSEFEPALTEMYGISAEELQSIKMVPMFEAFFYRLMNTKSLAEIAAFIIPSHLIAEDLGKGMNEIGYNDPVYTNGYKLWTDIGQWFEKQLDQQMGSASKEENEKINEIYTMGCNYLLLILGAVESGQIWPFGDIKVC